MMIYNLLYKLYHGAENVSMTPSRNKSTKNCPKGAVLWGRRTQELLVDLFLQSLTGLEDGNGGSGDLNSLFGAGVPANAGLTVLGLESAKANQLNPAAGSELLADDIQHGADDLLGILTGGSGFFCDLCNQLRFVHCYILLLK